MPPVGENVENAVIPGFYGSMPNGTIKTFSRGGSDITGSIVARAIGADIYDKYKNDQTEYSPSSHRGLEQAIFQGMASIFLPLVAGVSYEIIKFAGKSRNK